MQQMTDNLHDPYGFTEDDFNDNDDSRYDSFSNIFTELKETYFQFHRMLFGRCVFGNFWLWDPFGRKNLTRDP